ncbi:MULTISPECIES: hypothetical protein [unclassified Clostridioides]|uniref:hypothetical protein n=1 Tax=unclassified Clostridioides TaxID=2635829 RepID=UPI001D12F05D|nr:hypothetical protein [Clostridioides sp. ES-W-0018-02]MCC0713428.1 hypothetical protein [Clostridioides sp. ES-W-0017-02]
MIYKDLLKNLDDIENLKEVENLKCTTNTGEYTIENSKKGYITNLNIEGKTLVNLASTSMFILENNSTKEGDFIKLNDSAAYVDLTSMLNTGIYTLFINVSNHDVAYTLHSILSDNTNNEVFIKAGSQAIPLNMKANVTKLRIYTQSTTLLNFQMVLLEGDYTNKSVPYFDGLQSVGQGDNIEILSYKNDGNLFDGEFRNGSYVDDGSFYTDNNATSNKNFIDVDGNKKYSINYDLDVAGKIFEYDKNKKYIKSTSITSTFSFTTSENTKYINFFIGTNSVGYSPNIKIMFNIGEIKEYEKYKYDKKLIPYTLRSLPNGVKDEIVYKNNKYYLIKRCDEIILDGDNFNPQTKTEQNNDIVIYIITNPIVNAKPLDSTVNRINTICCDRFKSVGTTVANGITTEGIIMNQDREISFRILRSRLATQDIQGVKKWMKSNPIKVVYELETPQEIELTTLNLEQYDNQTRFMCNSNAIVPNISFESTQNLGSHIEVIRDNIKNINSMQSKNVTIDLSNKLLNGWKKTVSDNDGFIISKNGNQVSFHMRITGGATTDSTALLKLPNGFAPKTFYVFPIFTTQNNQLVQGFMYFNFANGYLQITQLGSNADIYSYGTYFIE